MSATQPKSDLPADPAPTRSARFLVQKLAIWGLFLLALYLARDFFFTAFMTFLFCYLTLALVGWGMARLSPDRERPWLRRLLTVAVFVLVPLGLLGVGAVVGPRLFQQGQELAGWAAHLDPEAEVSRLLEGYVSADEFKRQYGGPDDPRYRQALAEFRATGASHVSAYHEFPKLDGWIEGPFAKQFDEAETGRIRLRLSHEGPSSEAFATWFLKEKVPELQAQAREQLPSRGRAPASVPPLVVAAATATPQQLLDQVRRTPALLPALRDEWVSDTVRQDLAREKESAASLAQLRAYYDRKRAEAPQALPYTFDEYLTLRKARPQGVKAFGDALEKMRPGQADDAGAKVRADFEAAKRHELFQRWWGGSGTARVIRHGLDSVAGAGQPEKFDRYLASLVNIPVSLSTALLLSLFICIDFPNLRRGVRGLRQTWLREVYEEMAPAFTGLGQLIGRAMHAQGLIALCNAVLMFATLSLLGVAHPVLLAGAVFILCLVPTLGMVLAWVLIALVALIQPGGGVGLALQASAAVVVVALIETFVLSPRILGRMMELHPVLIIAVLPLAQSFFGVWGLILATPVAVYVIYELILGRALPGEAKRAGKAPPGPAPSVAQEAQASPEHATV